MDTLAHINLLIRKAEKLTAERDELLKSGQALQREVEELKSSLSQQLKENEALGNKIKIIKLAQNIGSDGSDKPELTELKRKINEYIKEIDYCMTMLNE